MRRFLLSLFYLVGMAQGFQLRSESVVIHVAPEGSDGASGRTTNRDDRRDGPLQSIQKAILTARAVRGERGEVEVMVEIAEGRYELPGPLVIGAKDSGLTLAARPGARVEISGGTHVSGWQPSPENPKVWQTTLPQVRAGSWRFNQLFVDGHRATRARTPNRDYFRTEGPLSVGSKVTFPYRKGDLLSSWTQAPGGEVVLLEKWTDLRLPLLGVNEATWVASLGSMSLPDWMDEKSVRYWVENIPEALDQPDEWYLDVQTGILKYYPPIGWDPKKSMVTAPRLQELVRVSGDTKALVRTPVSRVVFRGLRFTECDYELPSQGLISQQTAVPIHGAVTIENSIDGTIQNCLFENLGGYAIELGVGSKGWVIAGNQLRSLGAGGIRVGDPHHPLPKADDLCESHRISDNDIGELGRIFAPASGIVVYQSGKNRIRHNRIHDLYYTGISVGWTWGYTESACRDNLVEFNLVERVGQGKLTDMGGIYTLGPQPGTLIRNNLFRDIESHDYGGWGLYTDEGSTGIVLENNVVYRCKSAGFHQHYGRDNVVRNNLFAFNHDYQLMRTRAEDHLSFSFTRNVVVFDTGELLGSNWTGGTNQFRMEGNLYWDKRLATHVEDLRFGGQNLQEWRRSGQDVTSVIADPLLIDPEHPEQGLRSDSPAFKLGFKAIDLGGVGVRPPSARD